MGLNVCVGPRCGRRRRKAACRPVDVSLGAPLCGSGNKPAGRRHMRPHGTYRLCGAVVRGWRVLLVTYLVEPVDLRACRIAPAVHMPDRVPRFCRTVVWVRCLCVWWAGRRRRFDGRVCRPGVSHGLPTPSSLGVHQLNAKTAM